VPTTEQDVFAMFSKEQAETDFKFVSILGQSLGPIQTADTEVFSFSDGIFSKKKSLCFIIVYWYYKRVIVEVFRQFALINSAYKFGNW